jgi:hypothetical protein
MWETIRISPEKWQQHQFGDQGGGFWVVAILGGTVVWYNDIEGGFNRSRFTRYGEIDEYWGTGFELEQAIQNILNEINEGYPDHVKCSPPKS